MTRLETRKTQLFSLEGQVCSNSSSVVLSVELLLPHYSGEGEEAAFAGSGEED